MKFDQLKWVNEPVRSTTTSSNAPANPNRPATTGTGMTTASASGPKTYPDHAVLNLSKDQLKAMPQFNYNK